jgi:hypothetical protein
MNCILPEKKHLLISTAMRVGSSWVGRMSNKILDNTQDYAFIDKFLDLTKVNCREKLGLISEFIKKVGGNFYIKSHCITPDLFEELTNMDKNLLILNILRKEENAIKSRFHYAKSHVKESDLLERLKYFGVEDVELENDLIKDIVDKWRCDYSLFNKELNSEQIITLNYEKLRLQDNQEMIRLIKFLGGSANPDEIFNMFEFEKERDNEIKTTNRTGNELFRREGAV